MIRSLVVFLAGGVMAQSQTCVAPSSEKVVIYRAGSLTRAFRPMEKVFTCQTGIQVTDQAMGSIDAGRQITAGGHAADLYAPADYLDIDLLMKTAGYSTFDIVFAHGRMVMAYSQSGLAAKKLPSIVAPGSAPFHAPDAIPKAASTWYETLTSPGVHIGGGNWFLDPGAYRGPMIFQLAEFFYHVPNLYNNLLEHLVIMGQESGAKLGKQFDFQFAYEHNARATALADADYRYVDLPEELNFSSLGKDSYYREHAVVVVPGLGTSRSARTIPIPGARLSWGITLLKDAPNKANAIKFLQLLLGPVGVQALKENGPDPITPAFVKSSEMGSLPEVLRPLVTTVMK
jgi:molybdate/tungstate transport system substrate-binding protein